jgi:OmcA/MtrC family decaheme c-type cytochrome
MSRKKLITLLAVLTLAAPLMFYGCSGDDGSAGPAGDNGATGGPGTGVVADETCVLCHGEGKIKDVALAHRIGQTAGSMTVTIQSVEFGAPVDNNVPVTVNFTFAATDNAEIDITNKIDLTTPATATTALPNNSDNLAYISFYLAQLRPGQNKSPDEWSGFIVNPGGTGSSLFRTALGDNVAGANFDYNQGTGIGSYTFHTSAVTVEDGYEDNLVTRAAIQVSGVPITLFTSDPYFNRESRRRPVANAWKDVVSGVGVQTAAPGAGYPVKNDVNKDACNTCHDPLAIHGGGRREYQMCQMCHNAKLEPLTVIEGGIPLPGDNLALVNLIHKIHNSAGGDRFTGVQDIGGFALNEPIAYPQAINNCTTCHQGPAAADNTYDNFMNRPSRLACGACHFKVDFATGVPGGHPGGVQTSDSNCSLCHPPAVILGYHAAHEGAPPTPNNPTLAGTLKALQYGINSVTVDNTTATIKFWIKNVTDNVFLNLGDKSAGDNVTKLPAGFNAGSSGTTTPSFLFAYTMTQDGVSTPADYTNGGRIDSGSHATGYAGQPQSVSIIGRPIVSNDNVAFSEYTVTVPNAFPFGAKMRAVALQGYFIQTSGGIAAAGDALDNVARHTPSVQIAVNGDAVRRTVVKSGYNATTGKPEGCLECHEVFEGHGGSRVNNAQVCVMCHNPNMTSSGRTITASPINPDIVALFGSDPLAYPEVTNNFKALIHGLHSSEAMRVNEFVDIRNRLDGVLVLGNEILFPGDLSHCLKCHVGTTYRNVLVPNALLTTEKITTGVDSETRAQIIAARDSVPNDTDLVSSATASACGYCHDTPTDVSHFRTMGGDIKSTRADARVAPPPLMPIVTP